MNFLRSQYPGRRHYTYARRLPNQAIHSDVQGSAAWVFAVFICLIAISNGSFPLHASDCNVILDYKINNYGVMRHEPFRRI